MNIPATKIMLIHWLAELEDQSVLEKLINVQQETVDLNGEQEEELSRRLTRYEAGETQFSSWDEVRSRIKNSVEDAS